MDSIDISQLQYQENLKNQKKEPENQESTSNTEATASSNVTNDSGSKQGNDDESANDPSLTNPQKEQLRSQIRGLFDDHQQITTFFVTNKENVKTPAQGYYNLTLTRAKIKYERVKGQQKNSLDYHLLTGECYSKGNKLHDDKSQEMLDLFNKISKDIQESRATVYEKKG